MAKRLLERQTSLIEHITSSAAIFGGEEQPAPEFEDIDRTLLQVEAKFSYAKRMEKITAMLPRTFELLRSGEAALVRAFVEACPPTTLSRLENARQFHQFLSLRWMHEAPDPAYICDVAACEMACAELDAEDQEPDRARSEVSARRSGIRRCPNVILLRCAYDVRPIFETELKTVPMKRETTLVIALPLCSNRPQIFEVIPAVFDLLAALDDWTDPPALSAGPNFASLLADLTVRGLVEVRQ
jgi:hypothetical protein